MEDNLMKYIVYITINKINKKFYVGVHKTENPDVFDHYLGCGVKDNDRYSYQNSKTPFQYAVNKYGPSAFIRKTLRIFDTLDEALELEKRIVTVDFINRRDTYNATVGGGVPPMTVKTIYQYDMDGNFIKEWSSITEASIYYKCSSTAIGKAIFDRTPALRFLWTEYKYEKIDLNNFKIDANKTVTYLYDSEGKFVKVYKSCSECARELKVTVDKVIKAINGKFSINKKYYASDISYENGFPIQEKINHKNDKLYQYSPDGTFIREWENYKEVKEYFGKNVNIHASIRLGQLCQGFQWSWEKVDRMKCIKNNTRKRKVGKYSLEGELLETFNTVREAKSVVSSVPRALKGEQKTAGGFIWKYIDD